MPSRNLVFICACLGMLLFGVSLTTLGSTATALQAKFHLDALASGTLFSILPIGILAGSLLFGPFSDRYGYKVILILSCLLIAAGFQGIAFASSLAVLKSCIFLFGLGGGAINGATNAVVADISTAHKGSNLSILGVFYAIGALGMPAVLAVLELKFTFEAIVSAIGYIPLAVALLCVATRFPAPKQTAGVPFAGAFPMLGERTLILIGFFLFCVSSFEAVINNWTTTYLPARVPGLAGSKALYALSLYVAGMAFMRILLGSVFRKYSSAVILMISFACLFAGCVLLQVTSSYPVGVAAMIVTGIGLAAGFPVLLGLAGSLYAEKSGTAFSIVLTIALVGNMLVNMAMGIIAEKYGVLHLTSVIFVLLAVMLVLGTAIFRKPAVKQL